MQDDIDIKLVARETIHVLNYVNRSVFQEDSDYSYEHLNAMLCDVSSLTVTGAKAHRYVGWVQCAICMLTNTSSSVFRDINKKHKEEMK